LLDEYPGSTSVGEVGDAQLGLELMGEYTKGTNRVHMCYSFEFLSAEKLDANRLRNIFVRLAEVEHDGWACWALTNHDIQRHTTRWSLGDDGRRAYALLMMCLRGSVCLYQGEELGLPEADISFEDLQDPYGVEFWPEFKGRDGCRTPMVWESDAKDAGFTKGKPWLPVSAEHAALSVDVQEMQNDSLLHYYRKVIEFRKSHAVLVKGAQSAPHVDGEVVSFVRDHDGQEIFCAFNLGETQSSVQLPKGNWNLVGKELGNCVSEQGGKASLNAYQALVATKV